MKYVHIRKGFGKGSMSNREFMVMSLLWIFDGIIGIVSFGNVASATASAYARKSIKRRLSKEKRNEV